jgi:hypothetical protein
MITDKQIPDHAVDAFLQSWLGTLDEHMKHRMAGEARSALAAAINAWPGVFLRTSGRREQKEDGECWYVFDYTCLPLPRINR